jgi:hypothetical protein
MIVNLRVREINRGALKLAQTPTLIKKKIKVKKCQNKTLIVE